jgi:DNA modification methylase
MTGSNEMPKRPSKDTVHRVLVGNSQEMKEVESASVDLVVTSPPYPMIEMWDEAFCSLNDKIRDRITEDDGHGAHELMHRELDIVWNEVHRVMKNGAIACINIGDATRSIGGQFQLFANHARVIERFRDLGFASLPSIIWRKPTNAPNKFMGSGMLPPGAYVTLEHEHILIFRKGQKRQFQADDEKALRNESAYFWEERNRWFSDVWTDLLGVNQKLDSESIRGRSGAFPFELPYRLINMYSTKHDTVLDPFLGTGTTTLAAIASTRNSIGYEMDGALLGVLHGRLEGYEDAANEYIKRRLEAHRDFTSSRECKSVNLPHGFQCMSAQEKDIRLDRVRSIEGDNLGCVKVTHDRWQ